MPLGAVFSSADVQNIAQYLQGVEGNADRDKKLRDRNLQEIFPMGCQMIQERIQVFCEEAEILEDHKTAEKLGRRSRRKTPARPLRFCCVDQNAEDVREKTLNEKNQQKPDVQLSTEPVTDREKKRPAIPDRDDAVQDENDRYEDGVRQVVEKHIKSFYHKLCALYRFASAPANSRTSSAAVSTIIRR